MQFWEYWSEYSRKFLEKKTKNIFFALTLHSLLCFTDDIFVSLTHAMCIPSLFCGFIFTSWSLLPWPQSSCSSSWSSCPQVCRQDGDQWQLGAGHRGNQRGRSRPADGQLWENGDRHDAGERHPPGSNAVTQTSSPALNSASTRTSAIPHISSKTCQCSISCEPCQWGSFHNICFVRRAPNF